MKTTGICLFLFFAAGMANAPAIAANTDEAELKDLSLEALMNIPVHSASGFDQHSSEAPSSVTILTKDDLRNFGYRTLGDAMSGVSGFYSTDDHTYQALGVRGFNRPGDLNHLR